MKVTIVNARLIEDGRAIGVPIWISDKARNMEAYCSEAAHKQIEAFRAALLKKVMDEQQDILKEGATYTIDFKYTFQE